MDDFEAEFDGDVLIVRGHGGVRAINEYELEQLVETDDPVTIQ